MTHPDTAQPALARHPTEDPPPRNKTLGTAVSQDEKDRVADALEQGGFENESQGVRGVMLAYAVSAEVRDAVRRALRVA